MFPIAHSTALLTWLPAALLALACLVLIRRRIEVDRYAASFLERAGARERGSHQARLQHPEIDLARCIGCGLCVKACPEDGVLDLMYGQAVVVHGARCVGHGRCAQACPTNGISITLGDLSGRDDLPALTEEFEAVGVPGLYVAGELGGFALVRTAVAQGTAVADAVARRVRAQTPHAKNGTADLLIVGAGPGGLTCALRAKELGIPFRVIDQANEIGGTVASYPRRKLVMTQPVDLPLHGRLPRTTYQKEELVGLWESLAIQHELPVESGVRLIGLKRTPGGTFIAESTRGPIAARHVCLALGRRGTPRKLGIPGEELPKVAYSLLDAQSYEGRRILVVGGGDSAIEAAVGLSQQPGNTVTISYRKKAFFRLKARNARAINDAIAHGRLRCIYESEPIAIDRDSVRLSVVDADASTREIVLENDEVFVFAGGIPPFELLKSAGISFDPKDRPAAVDDVDKGTGLLAALSVALLCAIGMSVWAYVQRGYYALDPALRPSSPSHDWLRPTGTLGLSFGLLACALFVCNLFYLARRSLRWGHLFPGSLKAWMGAHVFTGLFSLLCVLVHSGFAVRNATGGHALIALAIVVVAGSIGRYLYAFVPRAANGAEANLDDLRAKLASLSTEWDRHGRGFGSIVRDHINEIVTGARWRRGLFRRIAALIAGQWKLRAVLRDLQEKARREDVPKNESDEFLRLARTTYRLTVQTLHYEEVRAVLASWRYYHRWLALLMIFLAIVHIATAIQYGSIQWPTFSFLRDAAQ